MKKQLIIWGLSIITFTLLFTALFIAWTLGEVLLDIYFPFGAYHRNDAVIIGSLIVPLILAFYLSRKLVRRLLKRLAISFIPPNRAVISLFVIAYLITGMIGAPAVQNHNDKWAMDEFKQIHKDHEIKISTTYPHFRTLIAIPVLPFIVCSYHEYQLAGLYGWGGWDVQLWYFTDVKRLFELTRWIS